MIHGENRIPYWIDRRLTGLAEPDYDATISFGLASELEDSQFGKCRPTCSKGEIMVEGYPYDRHYENPESYRLKMANVENHVADQHKIEVKSMGKVRSVLLALLAVATILGLTLATAAICTSTL